MSDQRLYTDKEWAIDKGTLLVKMFAEHTHITQGKSNRKLKPSEISVYRIYKAASDTLLADAFTGQTLKK